MKDKIDNLEDAFEAYLRHLSTNKRPNTARTYERGLAYFIEYLINIGINPSGLLVSQIQEAWLRGFVKQIEHLSQSTQNVYMSAVSGFYKYLQTNFELQLDIQVVKEVASLVRKPSPRKERFRPGDESIGRLIDHISSIEISNIKDERPKLLVLRDRSIILLLADTDLEIQEISPLRRSDFSSRSGISILRIESRNAEIGLSKRISNSLNSYLDQRTNLDNSSGLSITDIPLFTRHDRGAVKLILPISETTIRSIVRRHAIDALGSALGTSITPRDIQSYSFISQLKNIFSTMHPKIKQNCSAAFEAGLYDDAIFNAMKTVEDQVRIKAGLGHTSYGAQLMIDALNPSSPLIDFPGTSSERESAFYLYRGAIGILKNPRSHRFLNTSDPFRTLECLAFGSLLMRMLDEIP